MRVSETSLLVSCPSLFLSNFIIRVTRSLAVDDFAAALRPPLCCWPETKGAAVKSPADHWVNERDVAFA